MQKHAFFSRLKLVLASLIYTISVTNVLYLLNGQGTYDLGRMTIKISLINIFATASKNIRYFPKHSMSCIYALKYSASIIFIASLCSNVVKSGECPEQSHQSRLKRNTSLKTEVVGQLDHHLPIWL